MPTWPPTNTMTDTFQADNKLALDKCFEEIALILQLTIRHLLALGGGRGALNKINEQNVRPGAGIVDCFPGRC